MKVKDRWLAVEVIGADPSKEELAKFLRKTFYKLFGILSVHKCPIYVVEKDARGFFIIKTTAEGLDMLRVCALLAKEYHINIVLASGTIKKLKEKIKEKKLWKELVSQIS